MEGEGLLFFYPVARSCLEPTEWSHFTKSHSLLYSLGYFAHICACVTRCNNKDEDCCRLESDSINMVEIYRRLWGIDCHCLQGRRAVFHIDDGGTTFLGDAGEFVPEYSSSRARRRCYWSPNIERRVKTFFGRESYWCPGIHVTCWQFTDFPVRLDLTLISIHVNTAVLYVSDECSWRISTEVGASDTRWSNYRQEK